MMSDIVTTLSMMSKKLLVVLLCIVMTICLSSAKSVQLILGNSATYRLFTNVQADEGIICRLLTQCTISKSKVKFTQQSKNMAG